MQSVLCCLFMRLRSFCIFTFFNNFFISHHLTYNTCICACTMYIHQQLNVKSILFKCVAHEHSTYLHTFQYFATQLNLLRQASALYGQISLTLLLFQECFTANLSNGQIPDHGNTRSSALSAFDLIIGPQRRCNSKILTTIFLYFMVILFRIK